MVDNDYFSLSVFKEKWIVPQLQKVDHIPQTTQDPLFMHSHQLNSLIQIHGTSVMHTVHTAYLLQVGQTAALCGIFAYLVTFFFPPLLQYLCLWASWEFN